MKTFKILNKEPYKFTSRDGKIYDKCKYNTDQNVTLDLFVLTLEIGQSYPFEEVEKEANGRVYKNWVLAKPKSGLELRLEKLEKEVELLNAFMGQEKELDEVNRELAGEEKEQNLASIPF